ncbi:GtrA family protein [Azohydromonas sp.]|uniref:GtrA family protein n=1 Tax=Azohydromonas sp. TaxID=1872666 RepID=UPI002BFF345B|nr:GtrA family protein [Azohydromonas sp.]HMM87266.1 GtrA family protein [Azohydromonas sp.]
MLRKLFRFGLVGAAATPVHYLALIVLVEAFGVAAVVATVAGSALGAWVNYALNRRFTFRSTKQHRDAVPRFLAVAFGTGVLNAVLVYIGADLWGLHYLAVQIVATLVVFLTNFLLHAAWSFREGSAA